jgi:hypothetical protein
MSWARLLKRVFEIDLEHCPQCGGLLKIIAAIEDPPVIAKILVCLFSMIFIYCCLDVVGRQIPGTTSPWVSVGRHVLL